MAWVSVPALAVRRSSQGYESVVGAADGVRRVGYRSLDGDFMSQLSFDHDGLVIDYPGLARRVP